MKIIGVFLIVCGAFFWILTHSGLRSQAELSLQAYQLRGGSEAIPERGHNYLVGVPDLDSEKKPTGGYSILDLTAGKRVTEGVIKSPNGDIWQVKASQAKRMTGNFFSLWEINRPRALIAAAAVLVGAVMLFWPAGKVSGTARPA